MSKIGLGIFWILVGGMLFFTASRTVSFIQATLPHDNQTTGYFALAAFDVGIIAWAVVFQHVAKGSNQKAIALVMVIVSFLGLAAAFLADTWIESAKNKVTANASSDWVAIAIWVTSVIVLAHVAAGVAFHLYDPKLKKQRDDEEMEEAIEEEARKLRRQEIKGLAHELAPTLARHSLAQVKNQYLYKVQEVKPLPVTSPKKDLAKTAPLYFSADGGDNGTEQEEAGPEDRQSPFHSIVKRLKGQ